MARIKINILVPAKIAIYVMFLNYYCFSVIRGSLIPYCSALCYGICAICFLSDVLTYNRGKLFLSREEKWWIVYAILSLLTVPLAVSTSAAIAGLVLYVKRLFLIIIIIYICKRDNSVMFPITLLTVVCTLSCIAILPNLASTTERLTLQNDYGISVNDVGSMLAYGSFTVLYFGNNSRIKESILSIIKVGLILLFCVVLFVSGSRKAFIGMIMLFALLFLFGRDRSRKTKLSNIILVAIIAIALFYIVNNYLVSTLQETSLVDRLFGRKTEIAGASDARRIVLIKNAIIDFIENPFWGLGFANYTEVHGTYSHCTYVEPLACSGLLGLAYIGPYIMICSRQIELVKYSIQDAADKLWQRRLLIFLIVFLFIGIGIPYVYKDLPCICLALFVASQSLSE